MSSMSTSNEKPEQTPTLFQKLGLQYYCFLLGFAGIYLIFEQTKTIEASTAWAFLYTYIGKLIPSDTYKISHSKYHNKQSFLHVLPLMVDVACAWALLLYIWSNYDFIQAGGTSSLISAVICLTIMTAPSIDASHQLLHRNQYYQNVIGVLNLVMFQFTTYPIEHLYLHHKEVGTKNDPITAPKNMNIFFYTIRAVFSSYVFNFKYSINKFLGCLALNWTFLAVFYYSALKSYNGDHSLALRKMQFLLGHAAFSLLFMQSVQYIEHYGLVYRSSADKTPITEICSWNTKENMMNNWTIFRFQRHSDHHMNAHKLYSTLELNSKMPQFPFSFTQAAYLSLIPPLWYYVANPLVDQQIQGTKVPSGHLSNIKRLFFVWDCLLASLFLSKAYFALMAN